MRKARVDETPIKAMRHRAAAPPSPQRKAIRVEEARAELVGIMTISIA